MHRRGCPLVTVDDRPAGHARGTTLVPRLLPRTGRLARRGGCVKGARRASRSDGVAALDAAGAAWTIFGRTRLRLRLRLALADGGDAFKGSRSAFVTMALTWRNFDSRVTATRTSALIWHTGGRSDLQRTGVNAILTPDSGLLV
jgi:hypothetical protein